LLFVFPIFSSNCWGLYAFRGAVKLELRCHQRIDGISVDPDPDWKFDSLLSELNSLETKLNTFAKVPAPFIKARPRYHIFHICYISNAFKWVVSIFL